MCSVQKEISLKTRRPPAQPGTVQGKAQKQQPRLALVHAHVHLAHARDGVARGRVVQRHRRAELLELQAQRVVLVVGEHGLAHPEALVGEQVPDLVLGVRHDPALGELEGHLELLVFVGSENLLATLVVEGVDALQVELLLLVEPERHRRAGIVEPHEVVVDVLGLDVLLHFLHAEVSGRQGALIPSGELRDGCSRQRLHGAGHTGWHHIVRRRRAEANEQGADQHARHCVGHEFSRRQETCNAPCNLRHRWAEQRGRNGNKFAMKNTVEKRCFPQVWRCGGSWRAFWRVCCH
eukprot:scaffold58849_cov70-Phaeocystis_antarctica.AAC.8